MKFKILFFFFIFSCSPYNKNLIKKENYNAKGFAYIYNEIDYIERVIGSKMNNDVMEISHQYLKTGSLIQITNPKNNESVILKNIKRIKYPDFYNILITKPVADKLDLKLDLPILEITEIKKNKSFVAEEAKIFSEEKKISTKAPVASVEISNISKNKKKINNKRKDYIYILIGTFFSEDTAKFLQQRIAKDVPNLDYKKIKLRMISDKETQVISGPYTSVNLLKNDYIKLKSFGFEELDVFLNE